MVAVALVAAVVAVGCETPPPPPITVPPGALGRAPSCAPATGSRSAVDAQFDPITGLELGLTAFSAAVDALGGNGTVVVTTDEGGRPDFRTVAVSELAVSLDAESDPVLAVEASRTVGVAEVSAAPTQVTDPLADRQWSDSVTPYSPIWTCGRGAGVAIAVVDTGVDRTHPDLAGHTTTGGASLHGAAHVTPGAGGVDPYGHGTHVAGIAAATAGNGIGIAGVAPSATIVPVRVLDEHGNGYTADVAAGITWAVAHGAEVVNLSLGSEDRSDAISAALTYAEVNDVVVVAAAGNAGAGGSAGYPAANNRTVAVASIDSNRSVSSFSTWGGYVDVAAPGEWIFSTYKDHGYAHMSGTSMATPFVSGVAAVLIDSRGVLDPSAVLQHLTSTADDAGAAGRDDAFGHGIINPVRALAN